MDAQRAGPARSPPPGAPQGEEDEAWLGWQEKLDGKDENEDEAQDEAQDEEQEEDAERARRLKLNGLILENMSESQQLRYEKYRRSGFPKAAMKRELHKVLGQNVGELVAISFSGVAKVFVGELVEEALQIMAEWKQSGPVRPRHVREAFRRLNKAGKVPGTSRRSVP
eukprot:TRINITY_DN19185_c0_g1_i1.p1 TRINITY_DN19185_c0_g1~~TRINITY_DN19185_c0_g1_i1.p1  ORF type:complete len:168 (-),score=45.17 TRINITY_DN19185_c0_g1_i1:211-714(-)